MYLSVKWDFLSIFNSEYICLTILIYVSRAIVDTAPHLKMSSAEVVCCKKMPNITDELSREANSADIEQTAPTGAV